MLNGTVTYPRITSCPHCRHEISTFPRVVTPITAVWFNPSGPARRTSELILSRASEPHGDQTVLVELNRSFRKYVPWYGPTIVMFEVA